MNIVQQGHPTLSQVAQEVEVGDTRVSSLIVDMWSALKDTDGIGLAANQVGVLKRVIIINLNEFVGTIINPRITKFSGKLKQSVEGCLSFDGIQSKISRDNIIVVEGFTADWKPFKKKFRALGAFCLQHEIDHLNGITIKDHQ